MRKAIFVFLSLVIFGVHGQDTCTRSPLKVEKQGDGTMTEFCQYVGDGTSAQVEVFPGSEFVTEDCKTCKCTPAGLACCQNEGPPTNIPIGCEAVPDGCKFIVVKTSDKNIDCYTGNIIERKTGNRGKKFSVNKILSSPETFALINLFKNVYTNLQQSTTPAPKPASFYNPYDPFGQQSQIPPLKTKTNTAAALDREPGLNDFLKWYNTKGRFEQASPFGPMFGGMNPQMYPMTPMAPMMPPSMSPMMPNAAMNGIMPGMGIGGMWNPMTNNINSIMNSGNSKGGNSDTATDILKAITNLLLGDNKTKSTAEKNNVSENTIKTAAPDLSTSVSAVSQEPKSQTGNDVSQPMPSLSMLDSLRALRDKNTQSPIAGVPDLTGMNSFLSDLGSGSMLMSGGMAGGESSMLMKLAMGGEANSITSMMAGGEVNPMMSMMGGGEANPMMSMMAGGEANPMMSMMTGREANPMMSMMAGREANPMMSMIGAESNPMMGAGPNPMMSLMGGGEANSMMMMGGMGMGTGMGMGMGGRTNQMLIESLDLGI